MNATSAAMTQPAADPPPRKMSRETRRGQLIEATIEVLAERGFARMTLTEVAKRAGLSHGLVNFHFRTKEGLMSETLLYLAEEYRLNWLAAMEGAGEAPAAQLDALLRADFAPEICTPARLSAWCSFWGEAQSRPFYQELCGANDDAYIANMEAICTSLIAEGSYDHHPARTARALRVSVEGVWLDLMTMNQPYSRDEALATVHASAAAFFPQHFGEDGLRAG